MPGKPKETTATIIPTFRYADAPAAIDWLCRAFGFEKHLVVPEEDGTIAHAQLKFGNGMIHGWAPPVTTRTEGRSSNPMK